LVEYFRCSFGSFIWFRIFLNEVTTFFYMRKEVQLWWDQARYDYEAARLNMKIKQFNVSVFLMQQCVEKALKALFFKKKNANPGLTHSLIFLAKETKVPIKYHTFLRNLMSQFTATRYPDAALGVPSELYDVSFAKDMFMQVEDLFVWFKKQF
jgi:HEPN domain-containing protein